MARAAVIPPSPPKRTMRGSRTTKSKGDDVKKQTTATDQDSDDSDDELGLITTTKETKAPKRRGRPPGRPTTKPTGRGKKSTHTPETEDTNSEHGEDQEDLAQVEEAPKKKRPGRPRKNPLPTEGLEPKTAPKPRGRPKAGTTKAGSTGTAATRKKTRAAAEADVVDSDDTEPRQIVVATNSTTMRSNILRGPAKKKTVTFQDVSDSDSEDAAVPVPTATGRRKAATKSAGASKTGLAATPARKPAASRRRKPAAAKKDTGPPLSPKKPKQMAKSLSAYASSDGEEDELNAPVDVKKEIKLVVHSPVKHGSEATGLSSPVRKINFTPKKASSLVDENGELKLPAPKHGSETNGLNSPVRKVNFTPNHSQHAIADNGHLALPPGKSIDFSDSVFMSSPARRPPASPFQFSLKDTPNPGRLALRDGSAFIQAPDFTPGRCSPLKLSPKKGLLGASFSQSCKESTPSLRAKTSLTQSPAKRIPSPLKSSMSPSKLPARQLGPLDEDVFVDKTSNDQLGEPVDKDLEMVEEVARDIFGIELRSDIHTSSASTASNNALEANAGSESNDTEATSTWTANLEHSAFQREHEQQHREIYDEADTLCFDTMETQDPESHVEEVDMEPDMTPEARGTIKESAQSPEQHIDEMDTRPNEDIRTPESPLDVSDIGGTESSAQLGHEHYEEEKEQEDHDHTQPFVRHPDEEQDAPSEESDADNDEVTLVVSEAPSTLVPQPISPYEISEGTSPLQRMQTIPPPVPTPPVREATLSPSHYQDSAKTERHDRPAHVSPGMNMHRQTTPIEETTPLEISAPGDHTQFNTPSVLGQQQSMHEVDLDFTPLAQQFGRWQSDTPSKGQLARPCRRGVFSLVGRLEQASKVNTRDSTDMSYRDLPRRSGANTPSLFAELPQPQSDDIRTIPETSGSPNVDQEHEMIDSPSKIDHIFEDPEPAALQTGQNAQEQDTPAAGNAEEHEHESHEDIDKENQNVLSMAPATPTRTRDFSLQTFHTVSKVPLKAEGEVSPLKLPRKRGLSLSTSPPRSSLRSRKPIFPHSESAPALSPPRKAPRVDRNPTPTGRVSTSRRSSGRVSAIPVPKVPSSGNSPAKTPRRNISAGQEVLRGAVVHVNVHTTEGEDASGIFVELLQQMGARCVKTWSWNPRSSHSPVDGEPKDFKVGITHVVYKDGGLRTLEKVKQAAGLVKCVGVGWVLE